MTGKEEGDNAVIKVPGVTLPVPRTFRAIDRLLARPIERLEEYLDQKRAENISAHVQAVDEATKSLSDDINAEPTVRQLELLKEWADRAASIGDENPELAAAWRAALDRIQSNDLSSEAIIRALNSLTAADIFDFVTSYQSLENLSNDKLQTLENAGLTVNTLTWRRFIIFIAILLLIIFMYILISFAEAFFSFADPKPPYTELFVWNFINQYIDISRLNKAEISHILRLFEYISIFTFAMFLFLAFFSSYRSYVSRFKLTKAGEIFLRSFKKYYRSSLAAHTDGSVETQTKLKSDPRGR